MTDSSGQPQKLWNMNFFLLWQGQLVSAVGDVIYEIALGFWILAVTGSTGLMGALMAASVVPRVVLSPFAGVLVDRSDRKWLLVIMDALRGVVVLVVAAAAYLGVLQVWMVFGAGVIIGIGAAFFNPTIRASLPDIVAREQLVQANSFFSMIQAGSGILGNTGGGFLYAFLGAPLMFLVNGLSYIFSSITEIFIKIPKIKHTKEKAHFFEDFKDGLRFVWKNTGLRFFLLTAGVLNFFAFIAIVLLIPLFQRTDFLGPARYGVTMAVFTGGMIAGMATTASVKIPSHRRMLYFGLGTVLFVLPLVVFPLWNSFLPMLICIFIGGYFNAIVNILIQSVIQLAVPQTLRGKVMGLLDTMTQGMTPIGMAVGGLLGEFLPLRWVISGAFIAIGLFIFPQLSSKGIRDFFKMEEALPAQTDEAESRE
jgi:DHA3 family macrolide efflux protein-like MFS transporter